MFTVLLPPGVYPVAVNKYIIITFIPPEDIGSTFHRNIKTDLFPYTVLDARIRHLNKPYVTSLKFI